MNQQQGKISSGTRQDNYRNSINYVLDSQVKKDIISTNERHSGCIERITILIQELERMNEAQKLTNQDIIFLKQELQKTKANQPNNQANEELIQKIQLERQLLDQYKQKKAEEINELEKELNRLQKELQNERMQKLDYVNRYQKQLEEVVRLQNELEKFKSQPNKLYTHIEDLEKENQDLKTKIDLFQNKILSYKEQIALLEDQLDQKQSFQLPSQGHNHYQQPQIQYQQQTQPQTTNYQKVTTYQLETNGTNIPTEIKKQVIQTLNGKTDIYEFSSTNQNIKRDSFASRLDQVKIQPSSNYEIRNSQQQNNVSASQIQRGSKYLPDIYKKDYNDLLKQVDNKPIKEYKATISTSSNKFSNLEQ